MSANEEAIPEKRGWSRAWDALVDANPVLAKELLVTARTPVFVASMVAAPVMLAALVLIVRLSMTYPDSLAGRRLFPIYFGGLSTALGIVGAALGSTVVVQEREAGALEALKFSALGPSRVAFGKFAAVVLAEVAVVLCTLPLLGFVLSMGGVSLEEAWVAVTLALVCGTMSASIGVAVSANAANTRRSLLESLVISGLVGIAVMIWMAVGEDIGRRYGSIGIVAGYLGAPLDGRNAVFLYLLPAFALATTLWVGQAATTSGLMDLAEDRSLPLKRWMAGVSAMGCAVLAVAARAASSDGREAFAGASMIAAALLAAVMLFVFVGEPVRPTRRMLAHPRSRLVRALYPWCLAPSVLFTLGICGAVLLSIPVLARASAGLEVASIWALLYLTALGGFMGAVAARQGKTRARQLGAVAVVALPFLCALLHDGSRSVSWSDVICPLWVDTHHEARALQALTASLGTWTVVALASLAAMGAAVRRVSARS